MSKKPEFSPEYIKFLLNSPKVMKVHTANALASDNPDELRAIQVISEVYNKKKPNTSNISASQAAAQQFLEQIALTEKILTQEIEQNFDEILKNHKKYSKTITVNKIYQLLKKISEYKIKINKYPKSPDELVGALNILIEIINKLDPREIIIITRESPHSDKDCIQLLIQISSGLPEKYINKVNIESIKPVSETKSKERGDSTPRTIPQTQIGVTQHQVTNQESPPKDSKYTLTKAKKKAKKLKKTQQDAKEVTQNQGTTISSAAESPIITTDHRGSPNKTAEPIIKFKLEVKAHPKKIKPCLVKKSKNRHVQLQKAKKIKHVHWQDENIVQPELVKTEPLLEKVGNPSNSLKQEPKLSTQDSILEVKHPASNNEPTLIQDGKESVEEKTISLTVGSSAFEVKNLSPPNSELTIIQDRKKSVSQKNFFGNQSKINKKYLVKRASLNRH